MSSEDYWNCMDYF